VVQGRLDNIPDLIDLTHRYVRAARAAGDAVDLLELDDADHFDLIDRDSPAWCAVLGLMASEFPEAGAARDPLPA
jgi:hypothetical protein